MILFIHEQVRFYQKEAYQWLTQKGKKTSQKGDVDENVMKTG